ncbi:helix-turn-helix domain-containing protein [Halomicroarcula sp. GCM10025817]|uniref:helix-turn-helix domain-containing protein n=1 Tax=Haloarcula TaxID=2237 RepID=UPI0023E7BABC|nr:helix-turn-helix domain-containing protein [Halomicroarcula sp. SYNS111]
MSINRLGEADAYWESQVTALTDRQEEVRYGARERGYYGIPRRANVRDVAAEGGYLGVSRHPRGQVPCSRR